jgi:hypothetical protein
MTELSEVLKHAQLAHFDNELTSFVVLMIVGKQEPELHMAVSQDDAYAMNAVVDMLKIEMLKVMTARAEERKQRE